jgi:hypothetical protein
MCAFVHEANPQGTMNSQKPFNLVLVFLTGVQKGRKAKMLGDSLVLGSGKGAHVVLSEEGVSRIHAEIFYADQTYSIRDLGSANGTYVNGQRIDAPQVLYQKDKITLGKCQIGVLIPGTRAREAVYQPERLELPLDLGTGGSVPGKQSLFQNKRLWLYVGAGMILVGLLVLTMTESPEESGRPSGRELASTAEDDLAKMEDKAQALEKLRKEIEERQSTVAKLMESEAKQEQAKLSAEAGRIPKSLEETDPRRKLAEEKFQQGLKELRGQNLLQAEIEFNGALALDPTNQLVAEYLVRTRRKRRAVAVEHYEIGKRYFSALRYDLAISSFERSKRFLEIESKNLDNESKGYLETLQNIQTYLERCQTMLKTSP